MTAEGVAQDDRATLHRVAGDINTGLRARCTGKKLVFIWLRPIHRRRPYTHCQEPQCTP